MKAFYIDHYGDENAVKFGDQPQPALATTEVLVKIHAASINPLDLRVLHGDFKLLLPFKLPLILGSDMAGSVVAVGSAVSGFKVGDEVYAKADDSWAGTFAEYIVIKPAALALKPKSLSMQEAAALPLVALTAWQALVQIAQLQRGQKLLVHAGSGGVGSIAIQLAKHLGATVATTTSSSNAEWVKALGADVVIDYKSADFADVIHDYDVVLDTQGGRALEKSLQVLKHGGRVISISGPPDADFARNIQANWLLRFIIPLLSYSIRKKAKKAGLSYTFLFMQPNGQQLASIAELVDAGYIRPVLDKVYPFAQTREALSYVKTGRSKGKVVVHIAV